ncbi:hypothetical protein [Vibrio parahaemolyticus]|uniref:hypothetical protein n=1 Tax=Vibrio parahaemolyticus TaxID=670 RepID=UPI00287AE05F|nr:hypothetical protein [Vibrio parahaemolyticus]MDS1996472.1 hypothetical protein [Vibrio parahaemolyticus]
MLTIRHRYHYGNVDINKDGVIDGKAITKNEIPALRKDGEYIYRPYKGSLDNVYLLHVQKVKLVNIVAFTHDELGISFLVIALPSITPSLFMSTFP